MILPRENSGLLRSLPSVPLLIRGHLRLRNQRDSVYCYSSVAYSALAH